MEHTLEELQSRLHSLPEDVQEGFDKSKYTDWDTIEVMKMERFSKPLQYRILVKKNGLEKKYLYYNCNAKLER